MLAERVCENIERGMILHDITSVVVCFSKRHPARTFGVKVTVSQSQGLLENVQTSSSQGQSLIVKGLKVRSF